METSKSPSSLDGLKSFVSPSQDNTKQEVAVKTESELFENKGSSEETETEKQLLITDQDDENEIKEHVDTEPVDLTRTSGQDTNHIKENIIESDVKETIATQQEIVYTDNVETKEVIKQIETEIPKLNGNHTLSMADVNEESCSSTSSASSHNLVIDHPLAEEIPPKKFAIPEENSTLDNENKSLKRKLSICENGSPDYKQIHLDINNSESDHHQKYFNKNVTTNVNQELDVPMVADFVKKNIPAPMSTEMVPTNLISTPIYPRNWEENMGRTLLREQLSRAKTPPQRLSDMYTAYSSFNPNPHLYKQINHTREFFTPVACDQYPAFSSSNMPIQHSKESTFLNMLQTPETAIYPGFRVPSNHAKEKPQILCKPSVQDYCSFPATFARKITPSVCKPPSPGPFAEFFTPSQSIQAPKLDYECFKCKSAVFDSFSQLREHQKACFIKDNHINQHQTATITSEFQQSVSNSRSISQMLTPNVPHVPSTKAKKKRFYLCSSCGTYHENWNLFLHIREIHNRHVCLYCIRLFPTAEKLSLHLEIKHDLEQNHYSSEEKLRSVSKADGNSRFLMCCTCQHVFSEHESFSDHICAEYMQHCSLCGQKGRHQNNCKANPEKRPKAKKKVKAVKPPTAAVSKASTKLSKSSKTAIANDNKFNNNQMMLPMIPTTMQTAPAMPMEFSKQNGVTEHSAIGFPMERPSDGYHSDDSTNMVIDETCITENVFNEMPAVNPFKALDERERLQQETLKTSETKTTLPPDRVPEAIPEPKPLIVPKMKLRVPKEFQKAVESEISSIESDDDEDDEEDVDEKEKDEEDNSRLNDRSKFNTWGGDSDEIDAYSTDEKDNTQEGDNTSLNLDRILKEIEKTKLDIQRTKKMLGPTNNAKKTSKSVETPVEDHAQIEQEPVEKLEDHTVAIEEPSLEMVNQPLISTQTDQQKLMVTDNIQENLMVMEKLDNNLEMAGEVPQDFMMTETIEHSLTKVEEVQQDLMLTKKIYDSLSVQETPHENVEFFNNEICLPEASQSPKLTSIRENMSWTTTPERGMYSPTPPPTPNSIWATPCYVSENSPTILQAVSERENIENIEKESEQTKAHTSESEKMDTSGEFDTETIQNQEESTMDIEEKAANLQNNEQNSSSTDLSLVVDNEPSNTIQITEELIQIAPENEEEDEEIEVVKEIVPPADGIEVANDDILITDLLLDRPIEKFEIIEFVRLCVKAVYTLCLYCNHARRIAVCGHSLVLHLLAQHRFAATVDSITAEELLPSTIVSKLKSFLPELEDHYFNLDSYSTMTPKENNPIAFNERVFECFQCRFSTRMHKDLYLHNRKMHLKTAILCFMCRSNFFSFSEILCHICPGQPNKVTVFDIKFRCCLCDMDKIPSPFRLMVHLRKKHFACDICLEDCQEQGKLSSHVWKHKLHHLCYRCGIAYRNKMDITKHLFWKHGTESIICKRCLQKRWRHVYHFCVPPASFSCDQCNLCFSKATYLKVHQRMHTGDFRYPCTEDSCEEKFVSRKLLLKHSQTHAPPEVKVEEKVESETDMKDEPETAAKEDEKPTEENTIDKIPDVKNEEAIEEKKEEEKGVEEQAPKRKKKKHRNKESLEDLNLIAPNLSESDSSEESDTERPKTDVTEPIVPNVMLSPQSEEEKEAEEKEVSKDTDKIMDIWENFKSFQASQQSKKEEEEEDNKSFTEDNYPTPIIHVASSDHDYCAMYKIRPRVTAEDRSAVEPVEPVKVDFGSDTENNNRLENSMHDQSISPSKKKKKSNGSGSSSSDSSSGSDSSCSCGSNCSCSTSGSSSSSSSSEDSDSSTSEGRRRIAKKKMEKAERNRLKSESSHKASFSENVDVGIDEKEPIVAIKEVSEPVLIETDLETAESDTDEEFYDEHPQKLASEMLAQKRLQLQAQMRLSPSHNFDIMENSRPSTPSLPEEMVKEKKVKLKKKKRDRKSSCKSQALPPIKLNLSIKKVEFMNHGPVIHQTSMQVPEVDLLPPYDLIASPGVAEPPVAHQPVPTPILQNNTVKPVPFFHTRMSEGSSCSDADSSLKRSQRARRPNKFYGYTSDDENVPGTPLMIGTRTFKPQPPPQLTWRKEDLPAPSKSILLNKQPRTPKTPAGTSGQSKKRSHQRSTSKKKQHKLPPIPTLKIRPPKIDIVPAINVLPPPALTIPTNQTYSSSRDDSDDSDSSDDDMELPASNTLVPAVPSWNNISTIPPATLIESLPPPLPQPPPPPQASAFNQKIPPALLPNPDFATIQYFKCNNIRYPIRPPAGARQPRDGESVYCYCRCPYDEVSEMIACDGENCLIEWFHFECVGIMVAPQGKWFCAECRPKYSNELYPQL